MIDVQKITKNYGAVEAVKEVSFSAADGRITALLGPNGAGKSTSLRILSTVARPDSGNAWVAGVDVVYDPMTVRQRIGVLPHNSGLYSRLTGIENIRYYGRLQGIETQQLEERIALLVEQLAMGEFCSRRTAGFSQGQQIKIALARALIHDPQHIILDEPTNGLDVMATRALREIILNLRSQGKCILFSSHIMQEVDALCDHVIVISSGLVRFDGSISDFRALAGTASLEDAFVQIAGLGETP
ncbi:MAG: ATP-binding cassette domain-containing protein [Gammaproteobacteria bacterium]|jgi:sodium transport system ATP-binding protein|nr:ATP-binding cassette domain-containing protein [Gammaproteobacteria bacterium]